MRKRKKEFIYLRCSRYDYIIRILFILYASPRKHRSLLFTAARQISLHPRHKFELHHIHRKSRQPQMSASSRSLLRSRDVAREPVLQRPGDAGAARDAASNTAQRSLGKIMSLVLVVLPRLTFDWHCFRTFDDDEESVFGGTLLQRAPLPGNGDRMLMRYVPFPWK